MSVLTTPEVLRATFADPELQSRFAKDGFVVVPGLLDGSAVDRLRSSYESIYPEALGGFIPTFALPDPDRKAAATEVLVDFIGPPVLDLLDDHRVFFTSFLMKWPDEVSALPLHQDWNYLEESMHRSAVAWVALEDSDDELDNGPLRVLPGSHRATPDPRGTFTHSAFQGLDAVIDDRVVAVPVRRGDVVIVDNGLLHCSYPNRSGRPRLAAAVAVAPVEAGLVHVVDREDGTWAVYDVDEQFFVDATPEGVKVEGVPARYGEPTIRPASYHPLTLDDVLEQWEGPPPPPEYFAAPAVEDSGEEGEEPAAIASRRRVPSPTAILTRFVGKALAADYRLISKLTPSLPILPAGEYGWTRALEARWPEIREEAQALLDNGVGMPRIEDMLGESQGNEGGWDTCVLVAHGEPVGFNSARCPATAAAVTHIPGLQSALLSVFRPGTHLPAHCGPNKGVLRYHLGLIVPSPAGSCRLRVGDQVVAYEEGRSLLFDDTFEHEAWNDGDGIRVTLMCEVVRPLPAPARQFNGLVQRLFGLLPQVRGARRRLVELEWALNGGR